MKEKLNDRIYVATFSQDALKVARENGLNLELDHTCISYMLDEENQIQLVEDIQKDLTEAFPSGQGNILFHGPFTEIHPAAIDHRIVEAGRVRLEEAYKIIEKFGAKDMVVHSGYVPFIYIKEWQVERSVEFWQNFMKDKPADFNIYVENVLEDEPYTLAKMMEAIDDERIKICLDIGHANAMTKDVDTYQWIKVLGPHIGHFHLHSNKGDGDSHLSLGQGNLDFEKIFETIDTYCKKEVAFTLECRDCKASVEWLKEHGYI